MLRKLFRKKPKDPTKSKPKPKIKRRDNTQDYPLIGKYFKLCGPLHSLMCTEKAEYKKTKIIVGFIYGILLGLAFYELILVDLSFTEDMAFIVGGTVCLLLAFGLAFSSQIRCIITLTYPTIAGKVGRAVLLALVVTYIIAGPIENLSTNAKEVVRVFACTASLQFNLTKTRFELMFKPFVEALFGLKTDAHEVKDTVRSIQDASGPITGEIEGEEEMRKLKEENDYIDVKAGDTKQSNLIGAKYETKGEKVEAARFEKMYMEKVELRCENQFIKAANKCRGIFKAGYDKCYDTVTWVAAWLLCWPMKLDFVCNIAEALGGASRCDPSKDIDPGLGEGYSYLKHSRTGFAENFKNVQLQYKIDKYKKLADVKTARDTAVAVMHEVNKKRRIFMALMVILKRILAFIFLRILLNAQTYHDRYLREIDFDNIYITFYFRKIDARRRKQGHHTLLPLKKIEKKKLVDPRSLVPIKREREQVWKQTIMLLFEMITATIFVLLDRLVYELLDLVRRHGKISYHQIGHHDMFLQVKGTGMIASLLRSVVKGFNVKKRINVVRTNEQCLPKPSKMSHYYLFKIYGTYFAIWIMIFTQAYILRFRPVICGFFYRKREKKRILHLYNESLRRRRGFFKFMRKNIKKMVREHRLVQDENILNVLRIRYPARCDWLRIFPGARRKCIICGDPEPRKNSDYHECENETCHFLYCLECWRDVGSICLVCSTENEDTSSGMDDTGDDSDVDSGISD